MANYRIYLLDARDRIFSVTDVSCETDKDAFARARGIAASSEEAEIWQGRRLVGSTFGYGPIELATRLANLRQRDDLEADRFGNVGRDESADGPFVDH